MLAMLANGSIPCAYDVLDVSYDTSCMARTRLAETNPLLTATFHYGDQMHSQVYA